MDYRDAFHNQSSSLPYARIYMSLPVISKLFFLQNGTSADALPPGKSERPTDVRNNVSPLKEHLPVPYNGSYPPGGYAPVYGSKWN